MSSKFLLALTLLAAPLLASANISIQGSRVIYDQGRRDIDVNLQQVGKLPGFVQVWLDEGDASAAADEVNPAFALAPSIARMEPGGRQIVRIAHSRDDLPSDRESLLWLNVLETPLAANGPQPGMRTRIKFFYRPSGLASPPEKAHESLQFTLESAPTDKQVRLRVYNPSPYHVTFRELALQDTIKIDAPALAEFSTDAPGERMIAPMSELVLTLERGSAPSLPLPAQSSVVFSIITDFGGIATGQHTVGPQLPSGMAAR